MSVITLSPRCQGNPPLPQSCGPLDNFSPVSVRRSAGDDLQKEGGHDRRFQLKLGRSTRGQFGVRFLDNPGATPAY